LLQSARQSNNATPATTQAAAPQTVSIALADRNWQLSLNAPNLKLVRDETSPDKHARQIVAIDPQQNLTVSIFFEPSATIGDAKVARQFYFERLKHSPILMREDKFTDGPNDSARADYVIPDLDQHNVNLYLAKEGVWIDVHLSMEFAKPDQEQQQQAALDEIVKSVRIENKPQPSRQRAPLHVDSQRVARSFRSAYALRSAEEYDMSVPNEKPPKVYDGDGDSLMEREHEELASAFC